MSVLRYFDVSMFLGAVSRLLSQPRGRYQTMVWEPLPKTLTIFMIFPTLFMTWPKIRFPIYENGWKAIPFGVAHINIREYLSRANLKL